MDCAEGTSGGVGRGNSFSDFTSVVSSSEETETMPAPTNFTASQRVNILGNKIYYIQDRPYVDIILEWDDLDPGFGFCLYEHKMAKPEIR